MKTVCDLNKCNGCRACSSICSKQCITLADSISFINAEIDEGVKRFFNEKKKKKGYIEVANRKNVMEQFPLTSISIGVVDVTENRFYNLLEIGEVGAQVKHLAKTVMGSAYVIDRRKE